jgi:chemotaxis protein methyltransferase CheR
MVSVQKGEEHNKLVLQPEISDDSFVELREALFQQRGLDLDGYKDKCIRRRIAVRLRARQCNNLNEYLEVLALEPDELDKLIQAVTINVSGFFRNNETFDLIKEHIIPSILERKRDAGEKELNIWSAGCATGEEAYSMAIMLKHYFKGPVNSMEVSILGTDVNESFLDQARKGIYSPARLEEVMDEIKKRYFRKQEENFELVPKIRGMAVFEKQDILEALPSQRMDMILCRNLLIYLSKKIQGKIFRKFYHTLRPEGFLVLGKTESMLEPAKHGFSSIFPRERVYQRRN